MIFLLKRSIFICIVLASTIVNVFSQEVNQEIEFNAKVEIKPDSQFTTSHNESDSLASEICNSIATFEFINQINDTLAFFLDRNSISRYPLEGISNDDNELLKSIGIVNFLHNIRRQCIIVETKNGDLTILGYNAFKGKSRVTYTHNNGLNRYFLIELAPKGIKEYIGGFCISDIDILGANQQPFRFHYLYVPVSQSNIFPKVHGSSDYIINERFVLTSDWIE